MSLTPLTISGYQSGGLVTDKKPFLIPEDAFTELENAYIWRNRVKKREGLKILGRLRRNFTTENFFLTGASPWNFNIKVVMGFVLTANNANPGQVTTTYPHNLVNGDLVIFTGLVGAVGYNNITFTVTVVDATNFTIGVNAAAFGVYVSGGSWISNRSLAATEPNSEIEAGSVVVSFPSIPITFTDNADGTFTPVPAAGNSGTINYVTGSISLTHTAGAGIATTIAYAYFPALPAMGIWTEEVPNINEELTILFDTRYAYQRIGSLFEEFIPGTSWSGSDSDFFWATNYRGNTANIRLFFATNFVNTVANPIRFTNGASWTNFNPLISATDRLYQARIILPYYGRLIALNTFEGSDAGGYSNSVNIFNRCRFSQIGDPTLQGSSGSWAQDVFGKGGFIDAPINEEIISAEYYKDTLIVFFESSTWQLRYVGEYGLPFIWDKISSDYGSESTFSPTIFDDGVLAVGDRAIVSATSNTVARIDEQVPDIVFDDFRNAQQGVNRIWGIRDFQKELVYWCYSNLDDGRKFPNHTLLFNYKNNTYAKFRNNITCFGTFQLLSTVLWDDLNVFWDDDNVLWNSYASQSQFPAIISGNQQGFIHLFGYSSLDDVSLAITALDFTLTPVRLTIPNHNLETNEIIFVTGILLTTGSSTLNNQIYLVSRIDDDTIDLLQWDGTAYVNVPGGAAVTYIGLGNVILFPKMNITTKDFNPYGDKGAQLKLAYIDFQTDVESSSATSAVAINLILNSSLATSGIMGVGNIQVESNLTSPYYIPGSQYTWHRFYSSLAGQYIRIQITYNDALMNLIQTHQESYELNAMTLWVRPGGRNIF